MAFETTHSIYFQNASRMLALKPESVDLVVTSPPYPMIEMWDSSFFDFNAEVKTALSQNDGTAAFELMHLELDKVWQELYRVLKQGGFACINIGDATRTINGEFRLYPNHARILSCLMGLGFSALPEILWRKQTNAPNKFMGSGMLPAGAYVTLEHEYILVVRKGLKRGFDSAVEKKNRRSSAFFWEERNNWFSDIWMDLKGARQDMFGNGSLRFRSGAYPFELPYRLISMYSAKNDTVLDPFLGTGTTLFAAMVSGRNCVGYEIDPQFQKTISDQVGGVSQFADTYIRQRIQRHIEFVENRFEQKGAFKHKNEIYQFPVVTAQEKELLLNSPLAVEKLSDHEFKVKYDDAPQVEFCKNYNEWLQEKSDKSPPRKRTRIKSGRQKQLNMFKKLHN